VTKLNRRSQIITAGVARSPNRAMLRAVGFRDGDFEKPIVGVANGHSTMNPCNAGIQPLVDRVVAALREAGAMPQVFGFPTVTDGIAMGTEGMKYSLASREVIADSIEVAVNGQCMDGVVAVGGCDKNMPGSVMAIARMNVPGIFVYAGTIKPGASRLWLSTERMTDTNAANVRTALTACEYSHCRRAASKASGRTVQLSVALFIGYVNIQKITCVATRQRAALRVSMKARRSLRTMKVWINVSRSAVIIGIPKKDQPA
jgi:dihydroxyacid dehydratase/phosphogluconate dehydratase